jgi:hypothetical protein
VPVRCDQPISVKNGLKFQVIINSARRRKIVQYSECGHSQSVDSKSILARRDETNRALNLSTSGIAFADYAVSREIVLFPTS